MWPGRVFIVRKRVKELSYLTSGLFFLALETTPCLQHSWPHVGYIKEVILLSVSKFVSFRCLGFSFAVALTSLPMGGMGKLMGLESSG